MKKLLALLACAGLLAACGHKQAPAPVAAASDTAAAASDAASAPDITYATVPTKAATYDPNLKPAPTSVTVNLGASAK
jgi:ABC-type glycerol-3-phosphate transport system substrate-binding protein